MGYIDVGNGPKLAVATIACLVVSWIFSPVRIYVKLCVTKLWTLEDWCFLGGQLFFTSLTITALMSAVHGNGQKVLEIAVADLPIAMRLWFVCELLQIITTALMRLSLGLLLARICTTKRYLYTIYATMAVMCLNALVSFFLTIFQCHPIDFFWLQFSGKPGACLEATLVQNISIISSSIMAVVDVVFGVLPLFLIWNLQINRKAKIIAGCLLAVGIIAGATVVIRIKFIRDVSLTEDFLFAISDVVIWSMIEPCVGICCLSIVTYRPLFRFLADKSSTKGQSRNGYNNNYNNSPSDIQYSASGFSKGPRVSGKAWQIIGTKNSSHGESLPLGSVNNIRVMEHDDMDDYGSKTDTKGITLKQTVEVTSETRTQDMV